MIYFIEIFFFKSFPFDILQKSVSKPVQQNINFSQL